jgi:GPH family glycoside/pentoside/hexuronide:cation symporter
MSRRNELYPLGFFGIAFLNTLFTQWIVYFHAPPGTERGDARGWIGYVLLAGFVIQGVLNPCIGSLADRLGRRRPFILAAALPLTAVFLALWRRWETPVAIALLLAYSSLFVTMTQPYFALLPSVAGTVERRTRFVLTGAVFGLLASIAALVLGASFTKGDSFEQLGVVGACVLAATLYLPALLVVEPPVRPVDHPPFLAGVRELLRDPGLRLLLVANGLVVFSVTTLTILGPYVTETLVRKPRDYTATLNGFLGVGMLVSVPLMGLLSKRVAPLRLLQSGAFLGGLVALVGPAVGAVLWPWWAGFFLLGWLLLTSLSVPPLVLSKLADRDGRRREGLFFGLNGLAVNLGCAVSSRATTLLLELGRSPENPTGVRATLLAVGGALVAAAVLYGFATTTTDPPTRDGASP